MSTTPDASAATEMVYSDGHAYFQALLQDIISARTRIDFETYIFEADTLGWLMAGHLAEAARRGVTVRLLVDGMGSYSWDTGLADLLEKAGVTFRMYRPLPWRISQWRWVGPQLNRLQKVQYLWRAMMRRNHRKICLIDDSIAWVGSFNVTGAHLPEAMGGQGWRDTAVRLEHLPINDLRHAFESAWTDTTERMGRKLLRTPRFRLNYVRRRRLRGDLLRRIARCSHRIWITNAYFVPDRSLLRALKEAARRGVDVRVILPDESDLFFIPWVSWVFYQGMLQAGVRVFEYHEGMLHAKTMILDNWMTVGSTNLDAWSFFYNLEADVVLSLPSSRLQLEDQFRQDTQLSREIVLDDLPKTAWWKKRLGPMLLFFRRWL